jgi:hypothetical protein
MELRLMQWGKQSAMPGQYLSGLDTTEVIVPAVPTV